MELYAITISTNYDDLLNIIIHQNQRFFTRWYIVTSATDTKTIDVVRTANYPNVELLFYDFKAGGATFDKFGAARMAQLHCMSMHGPDKLTLFLDSDIYLPDNFLETLGTTRFDPATLYGAGERFDVGTLSSLRRKDKTHRFPWIRQIQGFFQLFIQTPDRLHIPSNDCSEGDLRFHSYFRRKQLLPITVFHLGKSGMHWSGRSATTDFVVDE